MVFRKTCLHGKSSFFFFFHKAESSVAEMVGLFITLSAVATPHGKFQSEWLKSGKVTDSKTVESHGQV